MDKRTGIIIAGSCILVLILIAIVFISDSKTLEVPSNVLLTVTSERTVSKNGDTNPSGETSSGETQKITKKEQYTADDYKTYQLLSNYDNGDITKKPASDDERSEALNNFILNKLYYNAALKHQVKSTSETDYAAEYEEKKADLEPYGVTSEQYAAYKKENDIVQAFKGSFGDYYSVPDDAYESVVDTYRSSGEYSTYSFRIMSIPYDAKSEEESGDATDVAETPSGEEAEPTPEVTETSSGEAEEQKDTSKEAQQIVAQSVVERFRSGEDFQELAKEFGSMRFTFVGSGYSLLNAGDLEYATSPLLKSKLGSSDEVYDAFMQLKPGECTEPIDMETYNSYQIVKLESVEDGFVGEGEKELKAILLSEIMDTLIIQDSKYDVNQSGYLQTL